MKTIAEIICSPEVKVIFDIFDEEYDIYLVGGCIRDVLSGKEVVDIDFAISIEPKEVVRVLLNNNIKYFDIGINYGTVTAVINSINFEITSFREDLETDGRHATVKYTSNIKLDSLRRDFTVNALYVNRDGKIFDFHNGISDIENKQLKFIGSPQERVNEDYLRILRYFRFYGDFLGTNINSKLKEILKKESLNLTKISNERIWSEFKKILDHYNSIHSLSLMKDTDILKAISNDIKLDEEYSNLIKIENKINEKIDNILKLSILLQSTDFKVENFLEYYALSNDEEKKLRSFVNLDLSIRSYLSIRESRSKLYRLGIKNFQNFVILNWIKDPNQKNYLNWHALFEVAKSFERPKFSFAANDIIQMGIQEGPLIGKILNELEEWWIDNDFIEDEYSIFERLKAICLSYK